jgi:hypothetical protein
MSEFPEEAFTEPENRFGFLATSVLIKMIYNYRSGVTSIFVADENIAPLHWGFIMKTPVKETISLKASHLQEAGILTHKLKSEIMQDFRSKPQEIGPQVLTMRHLEAGFVVILCLLALSVAVEIAPKLWKKLRAWLEKAVFCCVVVKFVKINRLM